MGLERFTRPLRKIGDRFSSKQTVISRHEKPTTDSAVENQLREMINTMRNGLEAQGIEFEDQTGLTSNPKIINGEFRVIKTEKAE